MRQRETARKSFLPIGRCVEIGDEAAEVAVALHVVGEQDDGVAASLREFCAEEGRNCLFTTLSDEFHRFIEGIGVGEREGGYPDGSDVLYQLPERANTIE